MFQVAHLPIFEMTLTGCFFGHNNFIISLTNKKDLDIFQKIIRNRLKLPECLLRDTTIYRSGFMTFLRCENSVRCQAKYLESSFCDQSRMKLSLVKANDYGYDNGNGNNPLLPPTPNVIGSGVNCNLCYFVICTHPRCFSLWLWPG